LFSLRYLTGIIILTLLMTIGAGCIDNNKEIQEYSRENCIMNTLISIRLFAPDAELGQRALNEAFAEFSRIEMLTDKYLEKKQIDPQNSDVYQINKNAGIKPVQVSEDTFIMLEKSAHYSGLSGGAFDITIGPLMDLWGFGSNDYRIPADAEIDSALDLVGYKEIIINREQNTVFLPRKGMKIDLGGIAKGYATDRAVQKLRDLGISFAIINAGGNIYALGSQPDGRPWRIGIQDPRDENTIIALLKVEDTAVVTSGDYERYFLKDGVRYHHILDPATGFPAEEIISSTILTPYAADADVLSTALFVLGAEKGAELIKKTPDINGILINYDKNVIISQGLTDQIEINGNQDYVIDSII